MEIRTYLKFLQRRWRMILLFSILTLAATAIWTVRTLPVYETTATYVVRISPSSDEKNRISALNTLMSSDDIPATYAKVANSRLIKRQAAEQLELSSSQRSGLSSDSQLIAGTNVLEVTTRGYDPTLVMNYANAVGSQMVVYAATLYDTFELAALDEATLPRTPILPDTTTNLIFGAVFGVFLGIGLALLREYFQPLAATENSAGAASGTPRLLEQPYFYTHLEKEISLAQVTRRPVSIALLDISLPNLSDETTSHTQIEALRQVGSVLESHLQQTDKMVFFEDKYLAFLLPDTSKALANAKLNEWLQLIKNTTVEIEPVGKTRLSCTGAIASNQVGQDQEPVTADQLLLQAKNSLAASGRSKTSKQTSKQNSVITA